MTRAVVALAAAVLAAAGCGGDDDAAPPAATPEPAPATVVRAPDVPADCREHVPRPAQPPPPELLQPPGELAVRPRSGEGAITRLRGYVAMEPGAFLEAWRARPDVTLIFGENEGFESEVHLQAGASQVFWQLKKVCDSGSTFTAIVTTGG